MAFWLAVVLGHALFNNCHSGRIRTSPAGKHYPTATEVTFGSVVPLGQFPASKSTSNQWSRLRSDIHSFTNRDGEHIAAFDVDGTLIKEKPLAEVLVAREITCHEFAEGNWPLLSVTRTTLCGSKMMPRLNKEQTYDLLLKPFVGQTTAQVQQKIREHMPRDQLLYAGFADLLKELHRDRWEILLVSVSLSDFVHAFADIYFPNIDVSVLSSEVVTRDNGRGELVRTDEFDRLDAKGKVVKIKEWGREEYDKKVRPLLAVGNTFTDVAMCESAVSRDGLCVMVEHDSVEECPQCHYPLWSRDNTTWFFDAMARTSSSEGSRLGFGSTFLTHWSKSLTPRVRQEQSSKVCILSIGELPKPLFCTSPQCE